jgi:chromosome segregation ATPase
MAAATFGKGAKYLLITAAFLAMAANSSFARQQQDSSQQSTGDPVADAARKARAKKKQEADKPKKVYTDEDLNHAVPDTAAPLDKPAEGTADASANAAATTPTPDDKPEIKWRRRFREAYAKLARAEKELDILQREANKAEVQYYPDPQKALKEQYTRKDINEKDTKIAAKKDEIAGLKQQISDMEDELRKAGGDPGWASPR